ncbi:MAG: 4-hydroxythreonine-4-phosphate dehydrogenase PdxA [Balneolaceae bacterium]|nr:4-hydroxythreonine-4-phosphate dehydrogenase PdxA [Balneolaceae bacterium]
MPHIVAISIGDINGIGPEVVIKSLSNLDLSRTTPVIVSPPEVIDFYCKAIGLELDFVKISDPSEIIANQINVLSFDDSEVEITPGVQSVSGGKIAMQSIERCIDLCMKGVAQAMVTAPISKEAVNLAGYDIPGHTEFLAEECGVDEVLMMLVSDNLRVALVTAHISVKDISAAITEELILRKSQLLYHSLKYDFGLSFPKIAVLGLNPHAGDGGVIGREEIEVIEPAIRHAEQSMLPLTGPFPADGFFGQQLHSQFDAILAMYHDQGLAPFKLLSFGHGVNFTAGLPIIRTSPDHGTAFNIAGKGVANPTSFTQAYSLAVQMAERKYGA